MGAVYEGIHATTDERVAIKALLRTLEDDEDVRHRFEAEIDTLKRLRHPNIVRLFGFGEEEGQLYYVMELVDGPSLHQEMRKCRLFEWHEVAKIGLEMCFALKHGHDRGITHRDLKPANILLDGRGSIKLSDYGIAQFFGSQRLTEAHSVVGTLEYMSPEQALALPVGPRSDIYSLGAVLYALLVGKPPFHAKNLIDIVRKHQNETPHPISATRFDVPEAFEAIILDLLKNDPQERPHNTYMIAKRLQSLLQALVGPAERIAIYPISEDAASERSAGPVRLSNAAASNDGETAPTSASPNEAIVDLGGDDFTATDERRQPPGKLFRESSPGATSLANSFSPNQDLHSPTKPYDSNFPLPNQTDNTQFSLSDKVAFQNPNDAQQSIGSSDFPSKTNGPSGQTDDNEDCNKTVKSSLSTEIYGLTLSEGPVISNFDPTADGSRHLDQSKDESPAVEVPKVHSEDSKRNEATVDDLPKVGMPAPLAKPLGRNATPGDDALRDSDESSSTNVASTDHGNSSTRFSTKTRFIKIDDSELGKFDVDDVGRPPIVSIQTIFASISLMLVGLIIWFFLQPVPPDTLYKRIKATLNIPDDGVFERTLEDNNDTQSTQLSPRALRNAAEDIRKFQIHYANHPKADMVRFFQEQLELVDKERELERLQQFGNPQKMIPVERAYLDAIATVKSDPEKTILKLKALIDLYGTGMSGTSMDETKNDPGRALEPGDDSSITKNSDEPIRRTNRSRQRLSRSEQCIEVARQRLKKLETELQIVLMDQINILKQRLIDAKELDATHPSAAKKIRHGLIQLYQDRFWARDLVQQARDDLEQSMDQP